MFTCIYILVLQSRDQEQLGVKKEPIDQRFLFLFFLFFRLP